MVAALPGQLVARLVREALMEDLGPGDLTCESVIDPGAIAEASITAGEPLVVAGAQPCALAFRQLDPDVRVVEALADGSRASAGDILLRVRGRAAALLSAERTALNFLAKLSGIATQAHRCVDAVAGTGALIYDTRKTTPGLRLLEKQAVAAGGACNHRFGLFDAVLIKDNHLTMAGSLSGAVGRARARVGAAAPIEVEIERLEDLTEAIDAGADIVLLDNMPPEMVRAAVVMAAGRVSLEASGGITLENLRAYAETGVNRISLGALTHSARSVDVSMTLSPAPSAP